MSKNIQKNSINHNDTNINTENIKINTTNTQNHNNPNNTFIIPFKKKSSNSIRNIIKWNTIKWLLSTKHDTVNRLLPMKKVFETVLKVIK